MGGFCKRVHFGISKLSNERTPPLNTVLFHCSRKNAGLQLFPGSLQTRLWPVGAPGPHLEQPGRLRWASDPRLPGAKAWRGLAQGQVSCPGGASGEGLNAGTFPPSCQLRSERKSRGRPAGRGPGAEDVPRVRRTTSSCCAHATSSTRHPGYSPGDCGRAARDGQRQAPPSSSRRRGGSAHLAPACALRRPLHRAPCAPMPSSFQGHCPFQRKRSPSTCCMHSCKPLVVAQCWGPPWVLALPLTVTVDWHSGGHWADTGRCHLAHGPLQMP